MIHTLTAAAIAGAALIAAPTALATFPGDNGAIAFTRGGDIWTIQPDGTGEKRLTSGAEHADTAPEWSPDGRVLLFERNGHIYRMNADGSGQTWIREGHGPQFSPDGKRIAYELNQFIYVAGADGSKPTPITDDHWMREAADWSPINDLILWWANDNTDGFEAESPTGAQLLFGSGGRADSDAVSRGIPQWSPDGTRIVHTFYLAPEHPCFSLPGPECPNPDPNVGVNVSGLDGAMRTIAGGNSFSSPTWSPDGTRVAVVEEGTIKTMGADGKGLHSVTAGGQPDWQPIARKAPPPNPPAPPNSPQIVTVTVPVEVPGPVRVVEKVVTRTVTTSGEVCPIPKGQRLTLTIRATRAIKKGAKVRVRVDLTGAKPKVALLRKR